MAMGRPRAFCLDTALNRALEVFWRKGYEGASLSDLTEAMGINRPSLYAAFGNKEQLFQKALERYVSEKTAFRVEALKAPTARQVAERLLFGAADMLTDTSHPVGCLAVKGQLTCGDEAESVRRELAMLRQQSEAAMLERFERAKAEGDLPPEIDPAVLTRYLNSVALGMSVQAAAGATRDDLRCVAETALRVLPA